MDDNNELIIYVLGQLRYGVPEQTIRATLTQNGWPQPLIDRAFSMVGQARPAADLIGGQPVYGMPAAQLHEPTETSSAALPMPDKPQLKMPEAYDKPARSKRNWRKLLVVLLALLVVTAIGVGGYFAYKAMSKGGQTPQAAPQPSAARLDTSRKQRIDQLATKLQSYYAGNKTYPAIAQINSASFTQAKSGFAVKDLVDPQWNNKLSCSDPQGNPTYVDVRSPGCFSYRTTAMNGADCNASDVPCTRVVLTANLSNNKPYIVALDKNVKE